MGFSVLLAATESWEEVEEKKLVLFHKKQNWFFLNVKDVGHRVQSATVSTVKMSHLPSGNKNVPKSDSDHLKCGARKDNPILKGSQPQFNLSYDDSRNDSNGSPSRLSISPEQVRWLNSQLETKAPWSLHSLPGNGEHVHFLGNHSNAFNSRHETKDSVTIRKSWMFGVESDYNKVPIFSYWQQKLLQTSDCSCKEDVV